MGDTAINVPIDVRSHELQQVKEMGTSAVERLRSIELDDEADELSRVVDEHILDMPDDADTLSMPADDWQTLVRHLHRLRDEEGLRVWWLRRKLYDRLQDKQEALES
jgi:hypothetical protein